MGQNFIACDREQELLLAPSLRQWLPEDHLTWFVIDALAELARRLAGPKSGAWFGRLWMRPAVCARWSGDRPLPHEVAVSVSRER
jgi:hypothetical protein